MREALRRALKPLADWELYPDEPPETPLAVRGVRSRLTVADVLRAREALEGDAQVAEDGRGARTMEDGRDARAD